MPKKGFKIFEKQAKDNAALLFKHLMEQIDQSVTVEKKRPGPGTDGLTEATNYKKMMEDLTLGWFSVLIDDELARRRPRAAERARRLHDGTGRN